MSRTLLHTAPRPAKSSPAQVEESAEPSGSNVLELGIASRHESRKHVRDRFIRTLCAASALSPEARAGGDNTARPDLLRGDGQLGFYSNSTNSGRVKFPAA